MTRSVCEKRPSLLEKLYLRLNHQLVYENENELGKKVLMPSTITFCWQADQIDHYDFEQVKFLDVKSCKSADFHHLSEFLKRAPLLNKLSYDNVHENWLRPLSQAFFTSGIIIDNISISLFIASSKMILTADLTFCARYVEIRTMRGALFDKQHSPSFGNLFNENYRLESHQLR